MASGDAMDADIRPLGPRDQDPLGSVIRTFMIVDIRGFTRFAEERGDEASVRLTERFVRITGEEVQRHSGEVVEFRGDEVLASFESPRHAIRAAAGLQERLTADTREEPPIIVGIGMDVGEAVPFGTGYRGRALNMAARLCARARPGEILATPELVHLSGVVEGIRFEEHGPVRLKGISRPVRLIGVLPVSATALELGVTQVATGQLGFRLLGPLEVTDEGRPVPLGGPRQRLVLAHLLMAANRVVPMEELVDRVWGDDVPKAARATIQSYVSHLRSALGADRIEGRAPGYLLHAEPDELDMLRFERSLRRAHRQLPIDPDEAARTFGEALELWQGSPLSDLADAPSLAGDIARLQELRLGAVEDLFSARLALAEHADILPDLEKAALEHPFRERLWVLLMLARYRSGRQADALETYRIARGLLAEELGIDPSPELEELHGRILRQDPTLQLTGRPLRGYRLLEQIGEGAFGVMWRGADAQIGRDVAVKQIHPSLAESADFVRRFEQEAQTIARLENPHAVPLYDYWRDGSGAYVVMRWMRGGNLQRRLTAGPIIPAEAIEAIDQVASALAAAHRLHIVHGDVKPTNVLLDDEGNAYLSDFCIGGGLTDRKGLERSGELSYLSPEQLRGEPPTPRSDIYSLGVIAGELLNHHGDLPSAVSAVLARATAEDPRDRFPDARELAVALRNAVGASTRRAALAAAGEPRNPYKGLRPFMEADADDFFGRDHLVGSLIGRLQEPADGSRFLAVVGPSGSGKSSVVRAGLVPALRSGALPGSDGWFYAEMMPGAHPMEELEAALIRTAVKPPRSLSSELERDDDGLTSALQRVLPGEGDELLLVVDQLEEVFTLADDEDVRERFLNSLATAVRAPDSRLRVVATLRADFYDRPLSYPGFADLVRSRSETVVPLNPEELEQAIAGPADRVGAEPELALIAEMVADVSDRSGALPLLQYALTELYECRRGDVLTLEAYRDMDGVSGAVAARAEELYTALDEEGRRAARQLFLRLVTPGEGVADTRRLVPRSELASLDVDRSAMETVIDTYGSHRLLSFDRDPSTRGPTAEVAHESLLRFWDRFRVWIDEARDDLRQHRRLATAASEWEATGHDGSLLLRGSQLVQFEAWTSSTALALSRDELEFLAASIHLRDEEEAKEQARQERERSLERRSVKRLRSLVAVLTAAALIAASLTVLAKGQRDRAERESRLAAARELASAAIANLEIDPERSILLAMEAVQRTRVSDGVVLPEAEEALHRAVASMRLVRWFDIGSGILDWSATGVFVAFGERGETNDGVIHIRDAATGNSVATFPGPGATVTDARFSPDGSRLATTSEDGRLIVWDAVDGHVVASMAGKGPAFGPSFGGDGAIVAAGWPNEGVVGLLDVSGGDVVETFRNLEGARNTAVSPGSGRIAVATEATDCDGSGWAVYDIDLNSGNRITLPGSRKCGAPFVTWSPDGQYIFANDDFWDATSGARRFSLPPGHTDTISSADWSSDGSRLVTGSYDGSARVWEVGPSGPYALHRFAAQDIYDVPSVAFSPDGSEVMTSAGAGATRVRVWDVSRAGGGEVANIPSSIPYGWWWGDVGFVSGSRVVLPDGESPLAQWDVEASERAGTIGDRFRGADHWEGTPGFDLSADGQRIAISPGDGHVHVWNMSTGQQVLDGQEDWILSLDLSPTGAYLALVGWHEHPPDRWERHVQIIDVSSGDVLDLPQDAHAIQLGPDDRTIALFMHRRVLFWDWRNGELISSIPNPDDVGGQFDPAGSLFVTQGDSRQPKVWSVADGHPLAEMPKQQGDLYGMAISPDGSRLAVGSADGTIVLFDMVSGQQLLTLPGNGSTVAALAFSGDGSILAAETPKAGTQILALDIDRLMRIAQEKVTRALTLEECRGYLHVPQCPAI
jgi:WD40 repeat protein/serine/threonine protein kinase/class 3 adenylate cyclase